MSSAFGRYFYTCYFDKPWQNIKFAAVYLFLPKLGKFRQLSAN